MNTFVKGDRVLCVGGSEAPPLVVGAVYTVAEYSPSMGGVVRVEGLLPTFWAASRFEKVVTQTFDTVWEAIGEPEPASDPVFRPHHYARFVIEPLTFINANKLPANIANVVKYVCRYDAKNGREDLLKARRYIDIQLECMDRDERVGNGEDPATVWSACL